MYPSRQMRVQRRSRNRSWKFWGNTQQLSHRIMLVILYIFWLSLHNRGTIPFRISRMLKWSHALFSRTRRTLRWRCYVCSSCETPQQPLRHCSKGSLGTFLLIATLDTFNFKKLRKCLPQSHMHAPLAWHFFLCVNLKRIHTFFWVLIWLREIECSFLWNFLGKSRKNSTRFSQKCGCQRRF